MTGTGWLLAGVGAGIVLVAALDAMWTTLWAGRGGGPLTQALTVALRRAAAPVARRRRWLLSTLGPLTIVCVVGLWIVLLWAGFTLVFASDVDAVVGSMTREPGDLVDRAYFVGYSLFTQGNGEYIPTPGPWQIATNVVNLVGFVSLTLAVTYFVPVVSAASHRRSFASSVLGLGEDGGELLARGWDGEKVDLGDHFLSYSTELSIIVQRHFAYPVLHSFHPDDPQASTPRAVAALDDALILLESGVPPQQRPSPASRRSLRAAIDAYAVTLRSSYVEEADTDPPIPDLEPLRRAGSLGLDPVAATDAFDAASQRRRFLLGLLHNEQVRWPSARSEGGAQE